MTQPNKIRLLIADDQEVIRCGLKSLLAGTEIKIIAEVATAQAAVKYAVENEVDVVLIDIRLPDGDGVTALGRIKLEKPDLAVLILSGYDNPADVARAVALGASGYLAKGCTREQLIAAIQTAAEGNNTWTREELRRVAGAMATPRIASSSGVSLTKREGEVLKQIAAGATNEQIAEALHISYETVKEHVAHVLGRIGVTDRTQAAVWAVRNNLA